MLELVNYDWRWSLMYRSQSGQSNLYRLTNKYPLSRFISLNRHHCQCIVVTIYPTAASNGIEFGLLCHSFNWGQLYSNSLPLGRWRHWQPAGCQLAKLSYSIANKYQRQCIDLYSIACILISKVTVSLAQFFHLLSTTI